MSIGTPSLSITPHQVPSGAPFPATAANNGLSVDGVTGKIVFGNDIGSTAAQLLTPRQIPLNGNALLFTSTQSAPFPAGIIFSDDPAPAAWVNIFGGSGKPQVLITDEQANQLFKIDSGNQIWNFGDLSNTLGIAGGSYLSIEGPNGNISLVSDGNTGFALDSFNGQLQMGDIDATVSNNVLSIDWSFSGGMAYGNGNGQFLVVDNTNGIYQLGDSDNSQSGNFLTIDDGNSTFEVFTFGVSKMLSLDRVNQSYKIGDIGPVTGNGTKIDIDDATGRIIFSAFQGLETNDPGSGAGTWLLGEYINGVVAFDPNNFVEIAINGTVVKLATVV